MSPKYSDEDIARITAALLPVKLAPQDRWCAEHFQKDDCWTEEGA